MHRPFAAPAFRPANEHATGSATTPSIREFLDDLPSIEDFVDRSQPEFLPIADFVTDDVVESASAPAAESHEGDSEGWAMTGWQNFDWSTAAALVGRTREADEANSAWDTLDWSAASPRPEAPRPSRTYAPPSADEVASALNGIARRIRSGELAIDHVSGTPPEAAMAAALAAMLRMRD